ncbi:MAG: DUF4347 domain-containing protein, partial [Cyanobacteria bacterium J06627_3]
MSNIDGVVFIDSQVQNFEDLITGISGNTNVHYLGDSRDGVAQISETLAQYQDLDAVYIFSHGSEGSLDLGSTVLSLETLDDYRQALSGWSDALSEDADLLFFGCNVAHGEQGQAFIQQLDELTGADVAASTDLTGHVDLGGDWTLESATGTIESYLPFATESLVSYQGTLASLSGSLTGTQDFSDLTTVDGDLFLTDDVTLNVDDFILGSDFTITGDGQGGRDSLTINADGKVTIAGDIFGGGIQDITINARDIEIQGTSLISTRLIDGSNYDLDESTGNSGDLTLDVTYSSRDGLDGDRLEDDGAFGNPAPTIEIQSGAQLFTHVGGNDTETAGNIGITALDETLQSLFVLPTQPHRSARIDIDGATIKGHDVSISSSGLDPRVIGDVLDFEGVQLFDRVVGNYFERFAAALQGLVLPVSAAVRISAAETTVINSAIEASGAVSVSSEATADASVRAYRTTLTPQTPSASTTLRNLSKISHVAAAAGYAETDAITTIEGTTINADSDVSLTSSVSTAAAVTARLFGNLQAFGQGASSTNTGITAAASVTDTTSKVLLDENSSIISGRNVVITSGGTVASGAKANTLIFTTGNLASSVAVNHDETDIQTLVYGDITAAGDIQNDDSLLIRSDQINTEDDTISFDGQPGFEHGEIITYLNEGNGGDISGLTHEQTYVVHVEADGSIKLSGSPVLDISALGVNAGAIHSLSRLGTQTISQVNADTDRITLENHGLLTGQQVIYRSDADEGEGIDGLFEDLFYYVRVLDEDTIELTGDLDQLVAGQKIDIESTGASENIYELEFYEQEAQVQDFTPSAGVDLDADTLTLNAHGFYNGQLVRYESPNNNDSIGGLGHEQYYFVIVKDRDTIQLAASQSDVFDTVAIALSSQGSGSGHRLTGIQNTTRFEAQTAVDDDRDVFTVNNHGFQTGDAVTYETDATVTTAPVSYINRTFDPGAVQTLETGAMDINNDTISVTAQTLTTGDRVVYRAADSGNEQTDERLVSGAEYYVIKLNDTTIQLAESEPDALAGLAIDLTTIETGFLDTGNVDIVNDTLSIAAQTLTTGDTVVYQSSHALDPDSAQNQAIGGLASNTEYYVIKLDDETVQLAASREQALANEAIDLTAFGTGASHTLFSEGKEILQVEDREIGGLEATEVYYVSVIDAHTFRLTRTPEEAVSAEFVDFNSTEFGGNHRLVRQTANNDTTGILIDADLVATDTAIGESAARSTPKVRHYLRNPDLLLTLIKSRGGVLNQRKASDILKGKKGPFDKISGKNEASVGFGLAINLVDHEVRTEVGSGQNGIDFDTILNSNDDILVSSGILQRVQTRAGGNTGKSEDGFALGLALGISTYDNTAQTIVFGNAQLNAKDAIDVTSRVEYPFLFDRNNLNNLTDSEGGDLVANLDDAANQESRQFRLIDLIAIEGLFGGNLLLTQAANTYALTKNTGKIDKGQIIGGSLGLNGSIAVNDFNNVSEALIKSGAQINQDVDYQTEQQSVNVQADTAMLLVGVVGILHTDIALDLLYGAGKKGWQSVFNPWGNTAQSGVGVSAFAELVLNETIAKIERGVKVRTGTLGTGLDVNAREDVTIIGVTQSGAQVQDSGLAGAGAGFEHISKTIAQLESGVTVTGGPLSVLAHSDVLRVNSALTLVRTKENGVGFSIAIDNSDRQVRAVIGDAKDDDDVLGAYQSNSDLAADTLIDVSGNVELNAKTTGAVVSSALGFSQLSPEGPLSPSETNPSDPEKNPVTTSITADSLKSLVGLTGGIAGNVQTETVKAYIYDAQGNGSIKTGGELKVESENHTLTLALGALLTTARTGGAPADVTGQDQNVFATTLGAAFNEVNHTTSSFIEGVEVDANNLQITANRDRNKGSRTLAIAFTPSITTSGSGQGDFTFNVSGSAALNLINTTTESYIDSSALRLTGNTSLTAIDRSGYYAAGGASSIGVLTASSDYQNTGTLGFGFGFNQVNNTTRSYLNQSSLASLGTNQQTEIRALADFESVAVSIAGAVSVNTGTGLDVSEDRFGSVGALSAAIALNQIDQNTVSAYVSNSDISTPAHGLTVKAEDSSDILAIGGGVSISAITVQANPIALSLGASAAVNTLENTTVEAYLSQSTVLANDVALTARSTAESGAYAIVGAVAGVSTDESNGFSGAFAGAGAGTGNYGSSTISAQVRDSSAILAQTLAIHALDESKLKSYAIGLSVAASLNASNTAAVGAGVAVALNEVSNTVEATIKGASTVNRSGNNGQVDVELKALSTPEIESVNVAGALSVTSTASNGNVGFGIAAGVSVAQTILSNTVTATIEDASIINNGGTVSVEALLGQADDTAPSNLQTIGGSLDLALAWSNKLGFNLGIAASFADNQVKNNTVRAAIDNATVTASNDIAVTADFNLAVDATNFSAALNAGASNTGTAVQLAGTGIGSYNALTNNITEALVMNGATVTTQTGSVTLTATDASRLKAHGGTGSLALGGAVGNGNGISVAVGAAVAENELSNTTRALIQATTVRAHQDLTVTALANSDIDALNIGVGAAVGGSVGNGGVGLAGAGIGSFNTLSNTVTALIQGGADATSETQSVRLTATDTSIIKADGGAGSLALGAGSSAGIGLAIGAAIAENKLANTIKAAIDAATVIANQDLIVEALADNEIDALNIGIGAGVGAGTDNIGAGLAGAGIGSYNTLSNTITATIQAGADATSETGTVELTATDTSTIKADGGAGSLAFGGSGGSIGAGVAVGVAVAQNTLQNTLKASIDDATVTAANDVLLHAATESADGAKSATIETISVGASLAAGFGGTGTGASLAGAGVGADNVIGNIIETSIQNSQVNSDTGKVSLNAKDQSKIDAESFVVSLSGAGSASGGAGAAAIAIAKATNTLTSKVQAFIGQAGDTPDTSQITAQDLEVTATSNSEIDARVVGTGVAIAISPTLVAGGISGSGVIADNTLSNTVEASVRNDSTLSIANTIDVTASDTSSIEADYGVGSGSLGLSGGVSIAVAVTETTFDNTVRAYIDDVQLAGSDQPDVTIEATETATLITTNRFASVGAGIAGLAGAGASATTTLNSVTEAYAKGNEDWSIGNLTIAADSNTDSTVTVNGGAVGGGLIAAAAGASLATVEDNIQVTAYIDLDDSAVLNAEDVSITATATPKATADATFVAVAAGIGLAGAGSTATATINPTVTAYVGAGTTIDANDLTVRAEQAKPVGDDASVQALVTTGEGGVGLSLGFTQADAHANGTVKAYIDDNAQIFTTNDVTVEAINDTEQFAGREGVANGGFNIGFSGGSLNANTHSDKTTEAYIGNTVALVAENLTLQAKGENQARAAGVTFGGAGLIAGRSGNTETQSTSTTRAYIGDGNASHRIKVFNTLDLDADYTNTFDKDFVVATGAIFGAGSGIDATSTIDSTVEVEFGNNLQLEAGDIQVDALNTSQKLNNDNTSLRSTTGAIGLSIALLKSETNITHKTDVQVGNGTTLQQNSATATEGIDLKARNVIDVQEKVKAQSFNLISGGGKGEAEIIVASDADIDLGQGSLLDASGDINLNSHSYNQVRTDSVVETAGLLAGGGVTARTHVTPRDTITLNDNAKVLSHGEVALTAGISGTEESNPGVSSIVEANASVEIYALIPAPSTNSEAETVYDRTHTITVNDGAEIASAKDTRLFAHEGTPLVNEAGFTNMLYGSIQFDDGASQTDNIGVTVNGTVRSRRVDAKTITFEEDANGTVQVVHQAQVNGETIQLGSTETLRTPAPDGVTLYQGSFQGNNQVLGVGRYANLADGDLSAFNNAISSLQVAAGYQAVLYTDANFQGDRLVLKADTDLSQFDTFNNQISSIEILHDPDSVIGYRSPNQTNTSGELADTTQDDSFLETRVTVSGVLDLRGDSTNVLIGDFNGDGKDDFIR